MAYADKLQKGETLFSDGYAIREGKTSPPKRYTSGSMVLAMENAGQLIEEEELREQIKGSGIGTSATRAEIIKKLVRVGSSERAERGLRRSAASAFPVRCAEERSRRRRSVTGAAIIRKMAADAASPSVQSPEET